MPKRTVEEIETLWKQLQEEYLGRICPRCHVSIVRPHPENHRKELRYWWKCSGCGYCEERKGMVSRKEVLMGRDAENPLTKEMEANLAKLLEALNKFRSRYGKPMVVSSGYRPGKYNKSAGGAKNSAHLTCEATDFADADGKLKAYVKTNPSVLEECGLYMEDPERTKTWIHLQIRATKNRVFKP
jgi:hypothetical protein